MSRPGALIWFKRDLRLRDHAPLQAAVDAGHGPTGTPERNRPLLMLYCFEPSVIADQNYDPRHWRFVTECLADLNQQLPALAKSMELAAPSAAAPMHEWLPFEFDDEPIDVLTIDETGPPKIWVFHREVPEVLRAVQEQFTIGTIFSHEETGLKVTFDRDKAVARFCRENGVQWQEFQSNGTDRIEINSYDVGRVFALSAGIQF